jgi:hypothetical protein
MGGKNFFELSRTTKDIKDFFISKESFEKILYSNNDIERNSLILHYIIDNPPFAFQECPLLYEQIRQFIAVKLEIDPNDIRLIGSAKTGFSISKDEFGRKYNPESDLDFAIINSDLFCKLKKDYFIWKEKFLCNEIHPKTPKEESFWTQNINVVKNTISRAFIDANKLPAIKDVCPTSQNILNTMSLVKKNLETYNNIKIRKASMRVYSNYSSFYGQTSLNISYVMDNRIK